MIIPVERLRIANNAPKRRSGVRGCFNMEWISVESKLPKTYLDVLVCDCYGIMSVGFLVKHETGLIEWLVNGEWVTVYGSHWMPLPEPPKDFNKI